MRLNRTISLMELFLSFTIFFFTMIPASFFVSFRISLVIILCLLFFLRTKNKTTRMAVGLFFFVLFFLSFYFLIALLRSEEVSDFSIRAYISFVSVFVLTFFLIMYYTNLSFKGRESIIPIFLNSLFLYCIIKLIVIFLPLLGLFNLFQASSFFQNNAVMTMQSRDQSFLRVATSNDLLLPFAVLFLLFGDYIGIKLNRKKLYLPMFLLISFLTFTRFIWVSVLVVILMYFQRIKIVKKVVIIAFSFLALFIILAFFLDKDVFKVASSRFNDSTSLSIKTVQAGLLLDHFYNHPLIGLGLGTYAKEIIRNEVLPFIYETQWIATLMQFGLIGSMVLFFVFLIPSRELIFSLYKGKLFKWEMYLGCMYFLFLLSAFTNPNLFALNSALVYFITYVGFDLYRSRKTR